MSRGLLALTCGCCSVLQYVAVCCSVLQCVVMCVAACNAVYIEECCLHHFCSHTLMFSLPHTPPSLPPHPRTPLHTTLWHQIRAAPWWLPASWIAWRERGECRCHVVWEHKGMSRLDTAAINSEVSFCKRARCVWGVWFRVCSKQDGISLPSTPPRSFVSVCFCERALLTQTQKIPNCVQSKEAYVYRALYQERKHLYPPHRRDTLPHLHDNCYYYFLFFFCTRTLTPMCVMAHSYVRRNASMCLPRLIQMCAMTQA